MKSHPTTLSQFTTFLLIINWTCFTFYSAIVVPIGTRFLDPMHQGLITQQVTHWLNVLTGVYVVAHLAEMMILPNRRRHFVLWSIVLLCLTGLLLLHAHLDGMIDPDLMDVTDGRRFYPGHRAYLWVSTIGWLAAGWLMVERLFVSPRV